MKTATCAAILAAVLFCSVSPVKADPITYSLTTRATGTFGGLSFTDAQVTVTLTGDTANVMAGPVPFNNVLVNPGVVTLDVSGFQTATFTDSIVIVNSFAGNAGVLFFDVAANTGILGQLGSVFSPYDLRGPFGPLSGPGGVASGSGGQVPTFQTNAGKLTWATGQSLGTSTFTAVVAPVPEPGTLTLLGSGLVALGAAFRRKGLAKKNG